MAGVVSELIVWFAASTLVVAFAAAAVKAMGRSSAASRHGVWLAAFVVLLAFPAARWLLPKASVIVARVQRAAPVAPEALAPTPTLELPAIPKSVDPMPILMDSNSEAPPLAEPVERVPTATVRQPLRGPSGATILAGLWAAGAGACLLQLAFAMGRLRRLRTRPADDMIAAESRRWATAMGLRPRWRLRVNDGPSPKVALTWGVQMPTVLLPATAPSWNPSRLEAVMLHELAHVRRRDSASQMLAATVCALYWFNPLVWLGARAMRAEAESAADDVVLGSGVRPSAYARELLRMAAELGGKTQPLPVAGVSIMKHSKIESRVVAILDGSRRRRAAGSLELLGALAIAMTAGLPLAILKPTIASTLRPVSLQKSSSDTKVIQDSPGEVKIVTTRVGDDAVTATVEMPRLKILARQSPPSPELKALMAKNAALQKKLKNRIPVVLKGYGPMTASLVRSLDAPVAGNMQAQRELNGRLRTLWAWFSRPDAAKSGGISKAAANAIVQSLKSDRPMIRELELDPVKVLTLDGGIDPKVVISDGGKPRYLDLKVRQSKDLKAITVQPDGIQIIGTLDKINADTIKANVGSADSAPRAVITTDGVTLQGDVKVGTAPRVIMLDSKDKAKTVTATADAKGTTSTITLDGVVSSDAKVGMIILDQGNPKLILKTDRQKVGQDKLDKTIQETIVTQVRDATRAQDAHPSIAELKKVIAALERASQAIKSRSGKDHQKDVTATVKMLEDIERQLREDMKKSGGK